MAIDFCNSVEFDVFVCIALCVQVNISARTKEEVLKAIQTRFVNFSDFGPRRKRKLSLARVNTSNGSGSGGGRRNTIKRARSKFVIPGLHSASSKEIIDHKNSANSTQQSTATAATTTTTMPSSNKRESASASRSQQRGSVELQVPDGNPTMNIPSSSSSRTRSTSDSQHSQRRRKNLGAIDETSLNNRQVRSLTGPDGASSGMNGAAPPPLPKAPKEPEVQIDLNDRLPQDLFEKARKQVYELMCRDSFKRWRNLRRKSLRHSHTAIRV